MSRLRKRCSPNSLESGRLEKWVKYATLFQSYVTSIAIVFGGVWAGFQYIDLKKAKMADLQLDKIVKEMRGKASIELNLNSKQLADQTQETEKKVKYIYTTLIVKNLGTKITCMEIGEKPLVVNRVSVSDDDKLTSDDFFLTNYTYWVSQDTDEFQVLNKGIAEHLCVSVNSSKKISYLTKVELPGLYLVRFETSASSDVLEQIPKEELSKVKTPKERVQNKVPQNVFSAETLIVIK